MDKLTIDDRHNPNTATFCASFAAEAGHQGEHCPTVALCQNSDGELFAVQESPNENMGSTGYVPVKNPRKWLDDRITWLEDNSLLGR